MFSLGASYVRRLKHMLVTASTSAVNYICATIDTDSEYPRVVPLTKHEEAAVVLSVSWECSR